MCQENGKGQADGRLQMAFLRSANQVSKDHDGKSAHRVAEKAHVMLRRN